MSTVHPVFVPEAFGFVCFVYFVVNPSELLRLNLGKNPEADRKMGTKKFPSGGGLGVR